MPPQKATLLPGQFLAEQLIARIRSGFYAPGQRLIESELMEDFDIGRGTVRETLRTLAGEGYLSFEKNRGACVRRFTRQEAIDRARVREMLEGLAARQAAEKGLDHEQRQKLIDLQDAMDRAAAAKDALTYTKLNEEFHTFVLTHSGNTYAADLVTRLSVPLFRQQFDRLFTIEGILARNEDHRQITNALLAGDPDAAEQAMRNHISKGIYVMNQSDDGMFSGTPSSRSDRHLEVPRL